MRRLHIDQDVIVSLDAVPETIQCRVLQVQGSVGRLAYQDELTPEAVGQLVLGAPGYLIFEQFGTSIGLRVAVRASPPDLAVAVMDGVALPERRSGERIKLATPVRILDADTGQPEQEPVWTETIDISDGGALLRSHAAFDGRERLTLELSFGDDPQPITAEARVARRLKDAVGVAFESIPGDDVIRLREYLAGIRHQRPKHGAVSLGR